MAIACAYCNGSHDTPAQVRRCWDDHGRQGFDRDDAPAEAAAPAPARASAGAGRRAATPAMPATVLASGVAAGPGPDALGRGIVVRRDEPVPNPWVQARRLTLRAATLDDPADALALLRAAHHGRERVVVELDDDLDGMLDRPPLLMTEAAPFEVGPRFGFELDELFHLVWSNRLDGRDGASTWRSLDIALAAGARSVTDSTGDIELPDGSRAWLDGGPLGFREPIDGVAVVHVVAAEHGVLTPPISNTTSADLAPDQVAAVVHPGGGARIIAPAGSGKTRVLTERARHVLTRWNLPPSAVSLVAFNKRAQEEMRERTTDLRGLHVRTLNAIALAIINGSPPFAVQPRTWRTIDEPDVRRIIGRLVSFPKRRNADPIAPWIEALGAIRLGLRAPDDVEARYDGEVDGLAAVWPNYRAALERQGAVDFDDQIYRALLVLLSDPAARRAAQRACRMMLVDEFQDLTPAHLLLVRLLSAPGGAVFGVGDDDQTIYGYNGADPAWLIEFASLFPGAGEHPLEVNYRCPAGVVTSVDRLLRHNRRRVAKTIVAASVDPGGWSVRSGADTVAQTVDAVRAALAAGASTAEIAVLTRVNALLAPVQVALSGAGVAVSGGVGLEFVDRTAIRAVLAWLRLAVDRDGFAPDDLREALRRPSRPLHPRIMDWVAEQGTVVDLHRLAGRLTSERDAGRVAEFGADIQLLRDRARGGTTSDVVLTLIDEIGLAGSVATLDVHRHGMNRAAQGDDLTAIVQLAALHDDPATFGRWLHGRLATTRRPDGVLLATVHRVKGQEWPHVVVHQAAGDQYPHRLAEDVEEERRLFHVALTRASTHATIVTGTHPSPFVDELTTEPAMSTPVRAHTTPLAKTPDGAKGAIAADPDAGLDAAGRRRYAALRELRNTLRDGKPAYVVFDNKTLVAIAGRAPTTLDELGRVSGVGPAKLERYGEAVIALIRDLDR